MLEKIKEKFNEIRKDEVLYKKAKFAAFFFVLTLIITMTINYIYQPEEVTYKEFLVMVEKGEVEQVNLGPKRDKFELKNNEGDKFISSNPKTEDFREFLLLNDIEIITDKTEAYLVATLEIARIGLTLFLFIFLIKKIGVSTITKKSNLLTEVPKTKFVDIAGNEEAKLDMEFLVNFLQNPKKYNDIGAKLPKGVVLYGPPGTGKTLTARAIAGEAGVPFFNVSGSDFIELFAGLGAKRVRDLYNDAKRNAPCIVFIDEIDAIGTTRTNGVNDGEKNQTINALLAELDGFDNNSPVITIVATNRVEDLDNALIRPGRFDKHIAIELPEEKDRLQILNVYAKNKKISKEVNLANIAKMTLGFSGAALEALMNEAAILAVNNGDEEITPESINEAYFKIMTGGHKKINSNRDYEEIELVAYHEAGHALVSKLLTNNSTPTVTIVPSTTGIGGATFTIPKNTNLVTKEELLNSIKVLYAGRAAEYILKGDENKVTTGASNDIKVASQHIKKYYEEYGMSEFGMLTVNEEMYRESAMRLSKKLYEETVATLKANLDSLEKISNVLIEKETIGEEELNKLIGR